MHRQFFADKITNHPLPVDVLMEQVRKAYPDRKIGGFEIDQDSRKNYRFRVEDPRTSVFINPYTGQIQGTLEHDKRFFTTTLKLHRYLLAGEMGKTITGISCVIFIILLLSGIIIWTPKNWAFIREKLTIRWSAKWRKVNYDLHSVGGFYASLLLLVTASTGLVWAFKPVNNAIFWVADGKPQDKTKPQSVDFGQVAGDSFYQQLVSETNKQFTFPGNLRVNLTSNDSAAISVSKEDLSAAVPNVVSALYFDQFSGKLVKAEPYESISRGTKIRRIVYPIHTGSIGGLPTRILALIASLFAASLPVTGFLIWRSKRKNKKGGKRQQDTLLKKSSAKELSY